MKPSKRLDCYKTSVDATSSFLAGFRLRIDYFSCWPQQDHKTLDNIVGTHVKLVLQISGTADFDTRSTRFSLGPMDCVVVPPYAVYSARTHENVQAYEIFFHIYPITREQEFLQRLGLVDVLHVPGLLTPSDAVRLAAKLGLPKHEAEHAVAACNPEKAQTVRAATLSTTAAAPQGSRDRGVRVADQLMSWSMEDSIERADAMRARGWGAADRRSCYLPDSFRNSDALALAGIVLLAAASALLVFVACSQWHFYPTMPRLVAWWGYVPYMVLALLPTVLDLGQRVRWGRVA